MGAVQTESAQEILAALAQHLPQLREMGVARIGLFGSGVRGELTPESDLDFLVDMADKSFRAYFGVLFFLEELFGRRIDLVMTGGMRKEYAPYILSEVQFLEEAWVAPERHPQAH